MQCVNSIALSLSPFESSYSYIICSFLSKSISPSLVSSHKSSLFIQKPSKPTYSPHFTHLLSSASPFLMPALNLIPFLGMTQWINGWKKRGWKKSSGEDVINTEDFKLLDDVVKNIDIQWVSETLMRRGWGRSKSGWLKGVDLRGKEQEWLIKGCGLKGDGAGEILN